MSSHYTKSPEAVVCFGSEQDYKRAALLFQSIVPIGHFPFDMTGWGSQFGGVDVPHEVLNFEALNAWLHDPGVMGPWGSASVFLSSGMGNRSQLSPGDEKLIADLVDQIFDSPMPSGWSFKKIPSTELKERVQEQQAFLLSLVKTNEDQKGSLSYLWDMQRFLETAPTAQLFVKQFLKRAGLDYPLVLPRPPAAITGDGVEEILATITDFPTIDVSNMSWDHVIEVRNDPAAISELQRLCNFVYKNYRNEPINYFRQELAQSIDRYKFVCKKHGIALVIGQLQVLIKNADIARSGLSAVIGATAFAGAGTGVALTTGFALGIADMALTFAKQRSDYDEKMHSDNLAYIFTMQGM